MNILLIFQLLVLMGWIVELTVEGNSEIIKLLRIGRVLPGTPFDTIIRAIALNVMYCCYRKSKDARLAVFWIWFVTGILLFVGTLLYQLYWIPKETDEYRIEIDALIKEKEDAGLEDKAQELILEKGSQLFGYKMWELFGWVRLFIQTLLDLWLICTTLNYYRELQPPQANSMPGVNKASDQKKGGDVEMAPVAGAVADNDNRNAIQ